MSRYIKRDRESKVSAWECKRMRPERKIAVSHFQSSLLWTVKCQSVRWATELRLNVSWKCVCLKLSVTNWSVALLVDSFRSTAWDSTTFQCQQAGFTLAPKKQGFRWRPKGRVSVISQKTGFPLTPNRQSLRWRPKGRVPLTPKRQGFRWRPKCRFYVRHKCLKRSNFVGVFAVIRNKLLDQDVNIVRSLLLE